MNITKKLTLVLSAAAAIALGACNSVDENERFIELPPVEAQRVVLLEEFTGQKCVNCPDAHLIIEGLLEQYPDNLIAVSLHGGGDAFSYDEERTPFGLRNAESQAYCDAAGVYSLPAGVVDRVSGVKDRDQWSQIIREELEKPSFVDIDINSALNDDASEITTLVTVNAHDRINGFVQVWVVESGIVARQQSGNSLIHDYVHNNVFRGTVNGFNGQEATLAVNTPQTFEYSTPVKDNWTPENLSIVAFVYNKQGVLQAAKAQVKN